MKNPAPRKRFGQNFLHDAGIIRRIVDSMSPQATDHFVEIGPGRGAMTQPLLAAIGTLDVVEIDNDLADRLEQQDWFKEVTLHRSDALKFDFRQVKTDTGLRLAGNLPYNISTPLLFHFLEQIELFIDMHVMLQKEVVQRMTAEPGNKNYGRLTVALAAHCEVESLFVIKPGAFTPAPKVDSAFARLTPLQTALIKPSEQDNFDAVLRHAFGQRRKQLGNALSPVLSNAQIEAAGIDPRQRAENLHVEDFVRLTRQLG